jgi:iron complex transport system substrate-binding protein
VTGESPVDNARRSPSGGHVEPPSQSADATAGRADSAPQPAHIAKARPSADATSCRATAGSGGASWLRRHAPELAVGALVAVAAAVGVLAGAVGGGAARRPPGGAARRPCNRIVSLAPSLTEMLFALGLGDRVVGVTRYCDFPPEALSRPKVGGYYDPNIEAIVALSPDLVVLLPEHTEAKAKLEGLGLATFPVQSERVSDVLAALASLGEACGAEARASEVVSDIRSRLGEVARRVRGRRRPRTLVCVGRAMGEGRLSDMYVAGRGTFYDEVLDLAGAANACPPGMAMYAALSAEGLAEMDPEVILDMVADLDERGLDRSALEREWQAAKGVAAVKAGRVYVLGQDYVVVPGPRLALLVEDVARLVHPDVTEEP